MKISSNDSINCKECRSNLEGVCDECSADIRALVDHFKSRESMVRAGNDIFGQGKECDAIYYLKEGWAFLYDVLEDGRRQILHFVLPGAVLGVLAPRGKLAAYGLQALTDVVVSIVPHKNFAQLVNQCPDIGARLAWHTSHERDLAYAQLTSVGRQTALERVAQLLLQLYVRYRLKWPGARVEEMYLPLTQEHIGDATGLTSVHVNRVLREMREKRVLSFHYRRLRILDPDKLIDAAAIDPKIAMAWIGK